MYAARHWVSIAGRVGDEALPEALPDALPAELTDAQTVCNANKPMSFTSIEICRKCQLLYFPRINSNQTPLGKDHKYSTPGKDSRHGRERR